MWIDTGRLLVNITTARRIDFERANVMDSLTAFTVFAYYDGDSKVQIAHVEVTHPTVNGYSGDIEKAKVFSKGINAAVTECRNCMDAISKTLREGGSICDLSGVYKSMLMLHGDGSVESA